jgi:hypothetical protein
MVKALSGIRVIKPGLKEEAQYIKIVLTIPAKQSGKMPS